MAAKRVEQKCQQAQHRSQYNQWVQPDDPRFKKLANAHFCYTIIIGISNNKSRKAEEEVNGSESQTVQNGRQVKIRKRLLRMAGK